MAPRVEYASALNEADPRCVVSIIACTGDWTGGWDCSPPAGADKFISEDLQRGRMVDVIERGEPALMLAHWTGVYWNGQELGFKILDEVVRRLHARFDHLLWMKLSDVARYWAAKELTRVDRAGDRLLFQAPFECTDFTVRFEARGQLRPQLQNQSGTTPLTAVPACLQLRSGTFCRDGQMLTACFALPRGASQLELI